MTCSCPTCDRPAIALGLCASHYRRRLRGRETGAPLRPYRSDAVRLELRISPATRSYLESAGRECGMTAAALAAELVTRAIIEVQR